MSTLASAIIANARFLLNDDGTRWSDAECLKWLSEAESITVMLKPVSNLVTADITLIAGTAQQMPAGSLGLAKVLCNVTGSTPGKVPRTITSKTMDNMIPNWRSASASLTVDIVVYDSQTPKLLWVYPPHPTPVTQKLSVLHVAQPAAITSTGTNITLADEYVPALTDYLVHRCFAKDAEVPESAARSQQALSSYAAKIGVSPQQVQSAQGQA